MPPVTIAAYLVEFDAALQARLGRRRRIVVEVEDHLREAATARLDRGVSGAEAEAAAIAAFGDPVSVAEGFGADPLARITQRLVVVGQSLDEWMGRHSWKGAALAASVPAVILLIHATVGVMLYPVPAYVIPLSALTPFFLTFLMWGRLARSLRERPEPGLWARATATHKEGELKWHYQWWLGIFGLSLYHGMAGRDFWSGHRYWLSFYGVAMAGGVVIWLLRAIARSWHPAQDGDDWANHHPWAEVLPAHSVSLSFAWLVTVASDMRSPLTIRLTVGVMVVFSASLFWLYRGSMASRKALIAFHYALVDEQQTQECLRLTQLGTAGGPDDDLSDSALEEEHDNEETSLD